jgi:hypothetical protein
VSNDDTRGRGAKASGITNTGVVSKGIKGSKKKPMGVAAASDAVEEAKLEA